MATIISHIKQDCITGDWQIQTNEEHCAGVAKLCQLFASKFDMGDWGYAMGLLHDKGKERQSFQQYICKATGYDLNAIWNNEDKKHAYIGAKFINNPFISYPIMGHHSGLDDYFDFDKKFEEPIPTEIAPSPIGGKLKIPQSLQNKIKNSDNLKKDCHHIIRMLFSCLVDADFLDTEAFMQSEQARLRSKSASLKDLEPTLSRYLESLSNNAEDSPINRLRKEIQQRCISASAQPAGFYSLTVPTGGGKTLSSLLWAIHHAIKQQKDRIIIAIPYTSIVTQTANILSNIFGKENVLEHHSNTEVDEASDELRQLQMRLATENWDYPIIVTTNVQLFESMFSNKPSKCRKLHNIVNSILILDEVQTLPLKFLQPIIDTLETYQRIFGTSVLFTTASLPALEGNITWGRGLNRQLRGIDEISEIADRNMNLHDKLRRVKLNFDDTPSTHEEIANRIAKHPRALCIVNSRKDARAIYESLPEGAIKLHLSRMMCSAHIREVIERIKTALTKDTTTKIWVIATQLIEAGVDIDFPIVFRQEAGLDSILQAAGRCNREGKLPISDTYIFRFHNKPYGSIRQDCNARENLTNVNDWFAPEAMTEYFIQRYSRCDNFDTADVKSGLYKIAPEWCFKTVAKDFKLIDDSGISVYVNYNDEADELIRQLKVIGPTYNTLRRLSQYSVSIRTRDFDELMKSGLINEFFDGCYVISDKKQYDHNVGLITNSHWLDEILTV